MATKKVTQLAKKRKSPSKRKTTSKRKGTKRRKKGMLSEMISKQSLKKSANSAMGGLVGGGLFAIADSLLGDEANEILRFGVAAGISVVTGGALDMPNVSAGNAGAYGYTITKKLEAKLLSEMENEDYADEDSLEEYPDALDENGTSMFLADDGNFYYLEEFDLAENNYALSETFQANDMYPRYVNSGRF